MPTLQPRNPMHLFQHGTLNPENNPPPSSRMFWRERWSSEGAAVRTGLGDLKTFLQGACETGHEHGTRRQEQHVHTLWAPLPAQLPPKPQTLPLPGSLPAAVEAWSKSGFSSFLGKPNAFLFPVQHNASQNFDHEIERLMSVNHPLPGHAVPDPPLVPLYTGIQPGRYSAPADSQAWASSPECQGFKETPGSRISGPSLPGAVVQIKQAFKWPVFFKAKPPEF
ncbi:PREDICTED: uncharacterized protein LOC108543867 [Rhinopithecus bieti]|uniref:uncharacterized protein LOC108543867 n=1 Tax=Rhinopithecus bieti TaxID=61621 RepID=UPI00083C6D4C|nr:PREDICTED: uncharacterized protein LOC108543867 [Rhinopithecus bieti]